MKILVTGGTGFIGTLLVRKLVARGHTCRCLVRKTSDTTTLRELGVELFEGDIFDRESLRGIAEGIDVVYHLVAVGKVTEISSDALEQYNKVNLDGARNIAEECCDAGIERFIHFSSTAAVGLLKVPVVDETTKPNPVTPYQQSKYETEQALRDLHENKGLPVIILRPSMVYGPGTADSEFFKICRTVKNNRFPRIGKGQNLTPIVHVDDVVQAALLAGEKGVPGSAYFIIDDSYEMHRITELIAREIGDVKRVNFRVPVFAANLAAFFMEMKARLFHATPYVTRLNIESTITDRVFSIENTRNDLGYDPSVPLEDGIRTTIAWYKENGHL